MLDQHYAHKHLACICKGSAPWSAFPAIQTPTEICMVCTCPGSQNVIASQYMFYADAGFQPLDQLLQYQIGLYFHLPV